MKYLLSWTNNPPEGATEQRFNSRTEAEACARSHLPDAQILMLAPKPGGTPTEVFYVWKDVGALQAGQPHAATITQISLGSTRAIDAVFIRDKG